MGYIQFKTEDIAGVACDFYVSERGDFNIVDQGGDVQDYSASLGRGEWINNAVASARVELAKRRVKVTVRFLSMQGRSGVATGIHVGNGHVMVKWDDTGKSEQVNMSRGRNAWMPRTPQSVLDEYKRVTVEARALKEQAEQILRDNGIDIKAEVLGAIRAAALAEATS